MARLAILVASAVLVCSCGASGSPVSSTRLRIAVYARGPGSGVKHYTLRCGPAGGMVPDPARACRVLASLARPFAPTPRGTICSDIALGPEEAVVTGVLRGGRIEAQLRVRGSCEIARWRRLAAVVPGFPRRS